jgi:hypothetical protein
MADTNYFLLLTVVAFLIPENTQEDPVPVFTKDQINWCAENLPSNLY